MRKTRICVLNSHPIQYFAPLYAFLNQQPDLEVSVIYLSDCGVHDGHDDGFQRKVVWDVDLLEGYPYQFISGAAKRRSLSGKFLSIWAPAVWGAIRSGGFDVLWLHGHGYAANVIALLAARSIGLPVLMRCETHLGLRRGHLKALVRKPALGGLYGLCAGFLAIGSANEAFYRWLEIPQARIFRVPYAVDNKRFINAAHLTPAERAEVRKSLGVHDEQPIVLYAAKFQRHKRPNDLVQACQRLVGEGVSFHLLMVGSGEMETELKEMVGDDDRRHWLHFPGFINQSQLPRVYGATDVFVLPSEEEPWGLVVNEAMCAGLPIIATSAVGSARDLVRQGENGAIYRAGSVEDLAAALKPMLADPSRRATMSRRSLELISEWGFEQCLTGLRKALAASLTGSVQADGMATEDITRAHVSET
jgi:glycosyltransferase involved in cell wall biosynthesis